MSEKPTNSSSHGHTHVSFDMNVPLAVSLSSTALEKLGWVKIDKMKWFKDGNEVTYSGYQWVINNSKSIQFTSDLPKEEK